MMAHIGTVARYAIQIKEQQVTIDAKNKHIAFLKNDNTNDNNNNNVSHGDCNTAANGIAGINVHGGTVNLLSPTKPNKDDNGDTH